MNPQLHAQQNPQTVEQLAQRGPQQQQLLPLPAPQQIPPYLINNWKRVLANAEEYLAKIRIINGVATITDGKIILRSPVNLSDGFYQINQGNQLRQYIQPSGGSRYQFHTSYPDVGAFEPPIDTMKPFGQMGKEAVLGLIAFCEKARSLDVWSLELHRDGVSVSSRQGQGIQDHFRYRFDAPGVIMLQPLHLKLALMEMLRYDFCSFFREGWDKNAPLIVGHDWGKCALINVLKM